MHELYNAPCGMDQWTGYGVKFQIEAHFESMYNAIRKSPKAYLQCLDSYANHYKSKHVMITAGMDFAFQFAEVNYQFFENVTSFYNRTPGGKKLKFQYSTVDEYMMAIQAEQKKVPFEWPTYNGDFFPLNGNYPGHYWTGYFSSRPNFKKFIRDYTAVVESSDTFYGLETLEFMAKGKGKLPETFKAITGETVKHINRLVGTNIHHDTLTGTSPSFVIQNETGTIKNREV